MKSTITLLAILHTLNSRSNETNSNNIEVICHALRAFPVKLQDGASQRADQRPRQRRLSVSRQHHLPPPRQRELQLDDSTHLFIQFGQGGGTYNAKTGEATNVAGVQQTDTHHEQRDSTAYYRNRYEAAKITCYELQAEVSDYKHALEQERTTPKRSGYDRFCSWWFWITAILLPIKVAAWIMEKIPATAPYIIIARRFIPFL